MSEAITGTRVLIPLSSGRYILKQERAQKSPSSPPIVEEWSNRQWMILTRGDPPPTLIDVESLPKTVGHRLDWGAFPYAAEWFLEDSRADENEMPSKLASLWEEIIRQPVIPYDPRVRRRELAHAYEVLGPYIDKIEKDAREDEEDFE